MQWVGMLIAPVLDSGLIRFGSLRLAFCFVQVGSKAVASCPLYDHGCKLLPGVLSGRCFASKQLVPPCRQFLVSTDWISQRRLVAGRIMLCLLLKFFESYKSIPGFLRGVSA